MASVVLFKDPDEAYRHSLEKKGVQGDRIFFVPLLTFSFSKQAALRDLLSNQSDRYLGLIFSSPRAVEAVSRLLTDPGGISLQHWQSALHFHFAIGHKTSSLVRQQLNLSPLSTDTATSAEALAHQITAFFSQSSALLVDRRPLLFLCGSHALPILPTFLEHHGIPLEILQVYDTLNMEENEMSAETQIPWTPELISSNLDIKRAIFVFFSPSGVKRVAAALQNPNEKIFSSPAEWQHTTFVAIGPTTGSALCEFGLPVACISSAPNPTALAECICQLLDSP